MKYIFLIVGALLLIGIEILRVYFIMPFPGSQEDETIRTAYFIHTNIGYFRLLGFLLVVYPLYLILKTGGQMIKIIVSIVFGFYAVVFYMFNFRFLADKMFLQPETKRLLTSEKSKVDIKQLAIGVSLNDETRVYPIEIIGYHHQVRDTVGGVPVMVTYCTVCRTGRVFSPVVEGQPENFRLVGMDHYNAMFEDSRTHTWWRQVTGEAIAGPLKGKMLNEVPSRQMSVKAWIAEDPKLLILQPDSLFLDAYKDLADFDEGKRKGRLERRDSLSWKDKSWVVGVAIPPWSKAYDWIDLVNSRTINDSISSTNVLIYLESDSVSFHVWDRDSLTFYVDTTSFVLRDRQTLSGWSSLGVCVDGTLKGSKLTPVQAYQEYWHSWRIFHSKTTQYNP